MGGRLGGAPARISVSQAGLDWAARHDVTLGSYHGLFSTPTPLIHVWKGKTWDFVPLEAFLSGSFLRAKPDQAIVIGDEKTVPEVFASMTARAGKLQKVPSIFTPDILNAAGTALRFLCAEWQRFASRYNMKVEDANAEAHKNAVSRAAEGVPPTLHEINGRKSLTQIGPRTNWPVTRLPWIERYLEGCICVGIICCICRIPSGPPSTDSCGHANHYVGLGVA